MYYSTLDDDGFQMCAFEEDENITKHLPSDSDKLLPEDSNDLSLRHAYKKVYQNIVRPDQLANRFEFDNNN